MNDLDGYHCKDLEVDMSASVSDTLTEPHNLLFAAVTPHAVADAPAPCIGRRRRSASQPH